MFLLSIKGIMLIRRRTVHISCLITLTQLRFAHILVWTVHYLWMHTLYVLKWRFPEFDRSRKRFSIGSMELVVIIAVNWRILFVYGFPRRPLMIRLFFELVWRKPIRRWHPISDRGWYPVSYRRWVPYPIADPFPTPRVSHIVLRFVCLMRLLLISGEVNDDRNQLWETELRMLVQ